MRGPDRDHLKVYERLLGKNLTTRDWRFGTDADGDVYAVADSPLAGLDADVLDGLLGSLSALIDETYETWCGSVRGPRGHGFDAHEGARGSRPPPRAAPGISGAHSRPVPKHSAAGSGAARADRRGARASAASP